MLDEKQFKFKWKEIRGGVRNIWGNLTDEELDQTDGDLLSIAQLIQSKNNESKKSIKGKLEALMKSFENPTDKGIIGAESSFERGPGWQTERPENEQITRH